jgi:hypothetical protein
VAESKFRIVGADPVVVRWGCGGRNQSVVYHPPVSPDVRRRCPLL